MLKIRRSTFETNSSSTHSLVMCNADTWNDFCEGKLYFNVLSRYHPEYLKEYPLDQYKWVPEKSCLNDLPIFCTFKQIKDYIESWHRRLDEVINNLKDPIAFKVIHRVACDALFFTETFYSIDELEEYKYDYKTQQAELDYYFG